MGNVPMLSLYVITRATSHIGKLNVLHQLL